MFQGLANRAARERCFGIDIGSYAIKVVLLEAGDRGLVVRATERIPTPVKAFENGVLVRRREAAALLRQATRRLDPRLRRAAVSVSNEHATIRKIEVPAMNPDQLEAAAPFEARKYITYSPDTAEVGAAALGDSEGETMAAYLVAAPRAIVHAYAAACQQAGLDLILAEAEPFALLRSLHIPPCREQCFWYGQSLAYAHIGRAAIAFCIAQSEHMHSARSISWGADRIVQALAGSLNSTEDDARTLLERPDTFLDERGILYWPSDVGRRETLALRPELERLKREIERIFNYFRSLYPERSYQGVLGKLLLSGGLSGLRGLDAYLTQALQLEVLVPNPFDWTPAVDAAAKAARLGPEFAVAIGVGSAVLGTEARRLKSNAGVWWRQAA
ncbi:MAG TPA: pilus assembly protein PilM [Chthonomonadaceae bacterium]|nr:pilus assembly protein PilM [Chthonomonadaceae bacterium]